MNEQGYRLLLRAYPAWYRRERGEEMLATLLDDVGTASGRWARVREAADIVAGGLRCRMTVRGRSARSMAVVVALAAAIGGAGLAGSAAWRSQRTVPTDAQAHAAVADAMPDYTRRLARVAPSAVTRHSDPLELEWGGETVPGDNDPATGQVEFQLRVANTETATIVDGVRSRLTAAGWRVGPVDWDVDGWRLWATKGPLTFVVSGNPPVPLAVNSDTIVVDIHHRAAGATGPASIAGFALAFVLGWLAAARTIRRYRIHGPIVQRAVEVFGVLGFMTAGLLVVATFAGAVALATQAGWSTQDWLVFALVPDVLRSITGATVAAVVTLALAAALAALPTGVATRRRHSGPEVTS